MRCHGAVRGPRRGHPPDANLGSVIRRDGVLERLLSRRFAFRAAILVSMALLPVWGAWAGDNTSLPFTDDFESYAPGTPLVGGANGWYGSTTNIKVAAGAGRGPSQGALIPVDSTLSNRFSGITATNVYVQFDMVPSIFNSTNTPAVDTNAAVLFYINSKSNVVVCSGGATTSWVETAQSVTAGQWVTVGINENFNAKTWDLYVNDALVQQDIGFVKPLTAFTGFEVYNGATTSYLDNVMVTNARPVAETVTATHVGPAGYLPGSATSQVITITNTFDYPTTKSLLYLALTNGLPAGWVLTTNTSGHGTNEVNTNDNSIVFTGTLPTNHPVVFTYAVKIPAGESGTKQISAVMIYRFVGDTEATELPIEPDPLPIYPATLIRVETAANGSGTVVSAQGVVSGAAITNYAIARNAATQFVALVTEAVWTTENETGGVTDTDLVDNDDGSAKFTGALVGTATIKAAHGALTPTESGTITVIAGAASQVRVETAANGSGTVVPAQDLASGSPLTVYAITRDAAGNFIENVAADLWALIDKTGGVADGDLVPGGDSKSATMTGALAGTAKIEATEGALAKTASGLITVVAGPAAQIRVETAGNGSGGVVPAQSVTAGNAITVYAVARDALTNFVALVTNAAWALTNKTGGVADGDLADNLDGSATFTGNGVGTANIRAASGALAPVLSGLITVLEPAAAYYVSPDGGHVPPFTNWATAATNVQDAVALANQSGGGATVWVSNGTYVLSASVELTNAVTVRGHGGVEDVTLDGGGAWRGVQVGHAEGVVFGLTISNCDAGAGPGGGAQVGPGLVSGCRLVRNAAGSGGGAEVGTGGLLRNCLLWGNTATNGGGVAMREGGRLENCTVAGNTAEAAGGGLYAEAAATGICVNTIAYGNAAAAGSNWAAAAGQVLRFTNSCVAPTNGTGIEASATIGENPRLVDAAGMICRLAKDSPCVDTGLVEGWMAGSGDITGLKRVRFGRVDMGAYEWYPRIRINGVPYERIKFLDGAEPRVIDGAP